MGGIDLTWAELVSLAEQQGWKRPLRITEQSYEALDPKDPEQVYWITP